jgi:putative peptidoglycan lipid II flippase
MGVVLLPTISEQIAREQLDNFRQSLNHACRIILALTIPAAVLVMVGIHPLVSILAFDKAGTELVVWVTRGFLVGLMGHTLIEIASRAFYAQQNALIPLGASFLATVTFVVLAISLGFTIGAAGIALANGLAFSGEALLLWYLLNRRFAGVADVRSTLVRVVPVALLAGLVAYGILQLSLPVSGLILGVVALGVGGLVVIPFILPELRLLIRM